MAYLVRKLLLAISRQRYAFLCAHCSIEVRRVSGKKESIFHLSQIRKIIFYLLFEFPESVLFLLSNSYNASQILKTNMNNLLSEQFLILLHCRSCCAFGSTYLFAQSSKSRSDCSFNTFIPKQIIRRCSDDTYVILISLGCRMRRGAINTNFDSFSVHLALYRFLQCQQRNMHRIFQLQVFLISFLKESFGTSSAFANGCGFPWKI